MEEWKQLLKDNLHLFAKDKRAWTPEEMDIAFHIHNMTSEVALRNTGCGSCKRSVIARCKYLARTVTFD
jgi:hypothetical protein